MLDKNLAADVLAAALSTGGSFAELFVENTVRNTISLVNGTVEKSQAGIDYGAGIRIFDGLNAVYAYTNNTSRENLTKVAREAAGAIRGNAGVGVADFTTMNFNNISPMCVPFETVPKKQIVEMLREGSASAFAYDALITQTNLTYLDVVTDVLIANSEGLWAEDRRVRTRSAIQAVASSETEKQTASTGPGALKGFEFYDNIDFGKLGRQTAETAVKMLKAGLCPSGKMPVIIDNGFGGVIFHEACGHSLEATSCAKEASVFWDKMGQKIASGVVTAVDDGTMPGEWGSMNMDDEGGRPQRNVLIENGVLKSFLVDRLNGMRMGLPSTGSSRRESYRFAPTSRMTNTFIAPGRDKQADIIADTEYGLYAKKMGGGSVMPATGSFNFAVSEAYIVRNGKIAEPVRGATLIGKGSEILMNIDRVSDNWAQEQGMCGSVSGSIPTNVGQPMIRVKEITVGGRSEE